MTVARPSPAGLASRTRPLPHAGDLLDALAPGGFAWLHDGGGLVTSGVAARVAVGPGAGRFDAAATAVARLLGTIDVDDPIRLPGTGPLAVGALPFGDNAAGELVVPAVVVGCTAQGRAWITETGPAEDHGDGSRPGVDDGRCLQLSVAPQDGEHRAWRQAVGHALDRIARGPLVKVVLAREVVVDADRPYDPRTILERLRRREPSSFSYAAGGFVGASPELLVRRRGDRVLSRPMAGTAPRGRTPADDERLVAELLESAKDADEHALVVGHVRAALERVCRDVVAGAGPEAVRLSSVTHLATTVAGHLAGDDPLSALSLAGLLHPTPAVGGLPCEEALAAIAALESFDRGRYAGPVGWVDGRGDGDWAVALRCATLDGTRARLAAGAGIVAGSDPDAEWEETEAKLEPMLAALAG